MTARRRRTGQLVAEAAGAAWRREQGPGLRSHVPDPLAQDGLERGPLGLGVLAVKEGDEAAVLDEPLQQALRICDLEGLRRGGSHLGAQVEDQPTRSAPPRARRLRVANHSVVRIRVRVYCTAIPRVGRPLLLPAGRLARGWRRGRRRGTRTFWSAVTSTVPWARIEVGKDTGNTGAPRHQRNGTQAPRLDSASRWT